MKRILEEKAQVQLLEADIVKISVFKFAHLEVTDVQRIHELKLELVGNRKHCVLLVADDYATLSSEAMDLSARNEIALNRSAKAIVIRSTAQRMVANFFLKIKKPQSTVKLFNSEAEAVDWLRQFNE